MSVESFNACVYLVDRQVQAGLGGHLAITGPAGSLTYAELAARAAELAAGFRAAGVRPEERVLLVATDRPETVITFCALLRMGAIPVPVSTMYRAEELGELVADSRARMVVTTPECAALALAAMHRHGSVARVCETYARQVLGIRQDDRCYSVAKLFFAYGLGNSLL